MTALEKTIKKAGSIKALADVLGVTKGAVWQWQLPGRRVPVEHCLGIVKHFGDTVTCQELRPDLDWSLVNREKTSD